VREIFMCRRKADSVEEVTFVDHSRDLGDASEECLDPGH
jgi:hypothetical protein